MVANVLRLLMDILLLLQILSGPKLLGTCVAIQHVYVLHNYIQIIFMVFYKEHFEGKVTFKISSVRIVVVYIFAMLHMLL